MSNSPIWIYLRIKIKTRYYIMDNDKMLFTDVVLVNDCIELKNSILGLWNYYAADVDIEEFFKYRRDKLYDTAQSYTSVPLFNKLAETIISEYLMENRRIDIDQDWYLVKYVMESSFEWYVDTRIERYMESATYEFTK